MQFTHEMSPRALVCKPTAALAKLWRTTWRSAMRRKVCTTPVLVSSSLSRVSSGFVVVTVRDVSTGYIHRTLKASQKCTSGAGNWCCECQGPSLFRAIISNAQERSAMTVTRIKARSLRARRYACPSMSPAVPSSPTKGNPSATCLSSAEGNLKLALRKECGSLPGAHGVLEAMNSSVVI